MSCSCEVEPTPILCVVCSLPVEVDGAHDFHDSDCPWNEVEVCHCEGLCHPGCCPYCLKEMTA